jgi:hypothetical protein
MLATHLELAPRSMYVMYSYSPYMPAWCGQEQLQFVVTFED